VIDKFCKLEHSQHGKNSIILCLNFKGAVIPVIAILI